MIGFTKISVLIVAFTVFAFSLGDVIASPTGNHYAKGGKWKGNNPSAKNDHLNKDHTPMHKGHHTATPQVNKNHNSSMNKGYTASAHQNKNHNTTVNKNHNGNTNKNDNTNTNTNTNTINIDNNIKIASAKGGNSKNSTGSGNGNNGNNGWNGNGWNGRGNGGFRDYINSPDLSYNPTFSSNYSPAPSFGSPSFGGGGGYPYSSPYDMSYYPQAAYIPSVENKTPVPMSSFDNDANTAWLFVEVPHDQAEVFLDGKKMPQKGVTRKYVTPKLDPEKVYTYNVKVTWADGKGGKQSYEINIDLKAGDEIYHIVPKEGLNAPKPAAQQPSGLPAVVDDEQQLAQRVRFAKELLAAKKTDRGLDRLKEIIEKYPNSKAAEDAKQALTEWLGK